MPPEAAIVDRFQHATALCRGKRVLDVGGCGMAIPTPVEGWVGRALTFGHTFGERLNRALGRGGGDASPFRDALAGLSAAAAERRIADYLDDPRVAYRLDLNAPDCVAKMRAAIDEFRPEVILCMETLEHVNYHFEIMNEFARAVAQYGTTVFITLPNNGNWVLNALGWNHDHSLAFFRDIAERFIRRSDLGRHRVAMCGCVQKYVWHWWLAYLIALGQPFSWGFTICPQDG